MATSLRRAWFATCALAVTVCAHDLTSDVVHLTAAGPLLWLVVFVGVFSFGSRVPVRQFRPWRGPRIVAMLVGTQFVAHLILGAAPWAVGLTTTHGSHVHHEHHAGMLIDTRSLVVHLVAAIAIGLLLRTGQRRITRLARTVVRLVRQAFQRVPRPSTPPWTGFVEDVCTIVRLIQESLRSRGPPCPQPA